MANKNDKVKKNKTFFKDFKAELKRVVWPTPKQVMNNTIGVVTIVIIVAVIVFALDLTFEAINKYGINQLKGVVDNTTVSENNVSNEINGDGDTNDTTNSTADSTDEAGNTTNEVENNTSLENQTEQ